MCRDSVAVHCIVDQVNLCSQDRRKIPHKIGEYVMFQMLSLTVQKSRRGHNTEYKTKENVMLNHSSYEVALKEKKPNKLVNIDMEWNPPSHQAGSLTAPGNPDPTPKVSNMKVTQCWWCAHCMTTVCSWVQELYQESPQDYLMHTDVWEPHSAIPCSAHIRTWDSQQTNMRRNLKQMAYHTIIETVIIATWYTKAKAIVCGY